MALLAGDRWLANARAANAGAARIGAALGRRLTQKVEANEAFARLTTAEAASLRAQGFDFYEWQGDEVRFVVSWDQPETEIAALANALAAL
jgi:threonine aldolase